MPYINLANFKFGLDARKSELTSNPGTLETLVDCHINQGGEIEKRKAFVLFATLANNANPLVIPGQDYGLEATSFGLTTFNTITFGTVVPGLLRTEVSSATGFTTINKILVSTNFAGGAWIVAQFANGNVSPYYITTNTPSANYIVQEFIYGRYFTVFGSTATLALVLFDIINGFNYSGIQFKKPISGISATNYQGNYFDIYSVPGLDYSIVSSKVSALGTLSVAQIYRSIATVNPVAAHCQFQITGGSTAGAATISSVKVNGVEIYNTTGSIPPLPFDTDNATTATDMVNAINLGVSTPAYTATINADPTKQNQITISDASGQGATANGYVLEVVSQGDMCIDNASFKITGGSGATQVDAISIHAGGQALLNGAVNWAVSDVNFAALIAAGIQSFSGTSGHTAFAVGDATVRVSKLDRLSSDALPSTLTVVLSGTNGAEVIAGGTSGSTTPGIAMFAFLSTALVSIPVSTRAPVPSVVIVTASGGTPPYTYQWNTVQAGQNIVLLSPTNVLTTFTLSGRTPFVGDIAIYTCTVTDSASNKVTTGPVSVTTIQA